MCLLALMKKKNVHFSSHFSRQSSSSIITVFANQQSFNQFALNATFFFVSASRDESKVLLNELSDTLEAERAAERERLEAKKMQDVERLKAEFEEELHAERTRLQKEREAKLSSLKNQVTGENAC